jgi:hypothetical protein
LFDTKLVEWLSREFNISLRQARDVIAAIDNHPEFTINRRAAAQPRKVRCKQCKSMKPSEEVNDNKVCASCTKKPNPDDRAPSKSIHAISGGLPSLGKKK